MSSDLYGKLRTGIWKSFNLFARDCASEVIWMDQDGPKPSGTYVTLKININDDEENPEFIPNKDGNIRSVFRNNLTVSVQTWGKDAGSVITTIRRRIQLRSWRDEAAILLKDEEVCAGIYDILPIQNLTELLVTSPEERRQMDVLYRYTEEVIDEGPDCEGLAITKINLTGDYSFNGEEPPAISKTSTIINNS